MSGKVFLSLLSFLLIFSFKKYTPGEAGSPESARVKYNRIDGLYNSANYSAAKDSACMTGFKEVINALLPLSRSALRDSLLFQSYFKLGILSEVYRNYPAATRSYLLASPFAKTAPEQFRIDIFIGAGFYNLNNFDSASYFLLKAGDGPADAGSEEDRVRLFNTLGVLYYDNGNYLQSRNYFVQALRLIQKNNPSDKLSAYSLQLNMATCYYKLGMYAEALAIYQKALGYRLLPDPLYMNMGRAYSAMHQYDQALAAFEKVNVRVLPGVYNEMANTAISSGRPDAAASWLADYRKEKKSIPASVLDDGVNELYSGELDLLRQDPHAALLHLQEALSIFSRNFTEKNIRRNPLSFTGSFAYYRLFDVLEKKGAAWEMLYQKQGRPEDLRSAYDSYQSTISLLSYIERSYEMDDAKLLLKQKSGEIYARALGVCLRLNRIFPDSGYLEKAFLISEKNKASVMTAEIRERRLLISRDSTDGLAAKERNVRYNIARLNTRSDEITEAAELKKINDEKSGYETQLVNIQKKREGDDHFYQLKYADDFPEMEKLQDAIRPDQALISFFDQPDKIIVFILTRKKLQYLELGNGTAIRKNILSWIQILQAGENGDHARHEKLNRDLYEQLMKPVIDLAGDKKNWVIIPAGIFFMLPLESLYEDPDGTLVIEKHEISYEFSSRFILEPGHSDSKENIPPAVLSLAPFSRSGLELQRAGVLSLGKLPYSGEEISGLPGNRFENSQATKTAFLGNLQRFPIIHLATHAITDLEHPSASFIAFSPVTGLPAEDFLFLDEIYALPMDSCRMMVVSACETGRGELVAGEGVMSFARAFLYAGCPSTINTLWKADDRSTSAIFKLFYQYLREGDTKSRALQKAKLEFIRENPLSRNPTFWSHIILTGNPEALYKKKQPWIWAVLGMISGTILFFWIRKRKKKKSTLFTDDIGYLKTVV